MEGEMFAKLGRAYDLNELDIVIEIALPQRLTIKA